MAYDKLVDSSQLNSDLGDVADAIRAKSGGSSQLAFPSGFISEIASISTGGGSYDGFEYVTNANNQITQIIFHGDVVPDFALNYFGWEINANNSSSVIPTLSFADHPTHIGLGSFHSSCVKIDTTNLDMLETIGTNYAMMFRTGSALDHSEVISLPKYTGRSGGTAASSENVFRYGNTAYAPKKYYLPSLEVIPLYAWYQLGVSNAEIQLGSVGHAVQESKAQPFGSSTNASGTITIYTTGSLLDSIKSNVQNGIGSNLTVVYKASEATTYNGTSYAAGDTMLTV